jgi:hypothetical protein
MSAKSIIGVIIVAILIGVLYVLFEKNFSRTQTLSNSQTAPSSEKITETTKAAIQSSLITLPTPEPTPAPLTGSSDLLKEAEGLQMRDYSTYFEEFKDAVSSK